MFGDASPQKPDDAFAAVPCRQDWYWIDDKDFPSKRVFSFIMFLFTLIDTRDKQGAPDITIPPDNEPPVRKSQRCQRTRPVDTRFFTN